MNLQQLQTWAQSNKLGAKTVEYRDQTFFVRELGDDELPAWLKCMEQAEELGEPHATRAFVALCLSDADGNRLVPEADETALPALPLGLLQHLKNAAFDVNGFGKVLVTAAKKSEQTSGSSTSTPSPSSSASVSPSASV